MRGIAWTIPCLASPSPHPQFSRMRGFVRAILDKRRIGIAEDLAHLPGGVGGHVDLVVFAVVAAGKADEFVDVSLDPFRRAGQPELARLGAWATGPG
jgi:hypothetical protein